jgi:hypothetical protein
MEKLNQTESLYAFCAWLTVRRESVTLGYDREFAPTESRILDEAINKYDNGAYKGCSCHINPPCEFCINNWKENEKNS